MPVKQVYCHWLHHSRHDWCCRIYRQHCTTCTYITCRSVAVTVIVCGPSVNAAYCPQASRYHHHCSSLDSSHHRQSPTFAVGSFTVPVNAVCVIGQCVVTATVGATASTTAEPGNDGLPAGSVAVAVTV